MAKRKDDGAWVMEGWQEVAKIIGMLVLIFVIGGWIMPKRGVHLS